MSRTLDSDGGGQRIDARRVTLADLLAALAVVGLVLAAVLAILEEGQRAYSHGAARVETQQTARDAASAARIARIASGSSTVAISRSRPPQRGHASTSTSNARRISAAHAQWRGADFGASLTSGHGLATAGGAS